ncbi:MAG: acyl-CoA synthetase [Parahaliea sp.]
MPIRTLEDIEAVEQGGSFSLKGISNSYELIAKGAAINPDAAALTFILQAENYNRAARWTYRELLADITRTANLLRRLGLKRNEVVAYVLPNLPETHLAIWGGETAGIVFALNALLEGEQMGELLRAADVRWLITTGPTPDPEIWQRVGQALTAGEHNVAGILAVDVKRHIPYAPAGSARSEAIADLPVSLAGIPVLDFHSELAKERGDALDFVAPQATDMASYFCTGGTTGLPKIACHIHLNELANAMQLHIVMGRLYQPGKALLSCLPLFHVNAQLGTGLAMFSAGGEVVLGPPAGYRAAGLFRHFWEIVAHHRVASFSGVPTVYASLLESPMEGLDLSCLDYAICGAAPMPAELIHTFERRTGMRVLEGYGLTESCCVASLTPAEGDSIPGSVGIRLPWQQMVSLILDEEGRYVRHAGIDEAGIIALSGPNIFAGYLSESHNASAWIDMPGSKERWFNTGDLARQDDKGWFWLTGRSKDLIIRGGHNIDPHIIEEAFSTHPAVGLSAAVGRPDIRAGEIPVAYVQLHNNSSASTEELLAHAQANIPERAAIVRTIYILEQLPMTAIGKIFKPALVMLEVESIVKEEAEALGVTLSQVRVEQDPKQGIVASYHVKNGDGQALAKRLGMYATFKIKAHIS